MHRDEPAKTILAYIDTLRGQVRRMAFECRALEAANSGGDEACCRLAEDLRQFWALWAQEIIVRYFEMKRPNAARQIPAAALVRGMSKVQALHLAGEHAQAIQKLLAKETALESTRQALEPVFDAFTRYQGEPVFFHNELLGLPAETETYLLDMQHDLSDRSVTSLHSMQFSQIGADGAGVKIEAKP